MAAESTEADRSSCPGERNVSTASTGFITVELTAAFDTKGFLCNRDPGAVSYIQDTIWDHLERNCGLGYVYPDPADRQKILGFYHLVGSSLKRADLQNRDQKRAPVGAPVSVFHIAYIARDDRAMKGLGEALMVDAARRARSIFPTWGISLHAKNAKLVAWYEQLGFKVIRELAQERKAGQLTSGGPFLMYADHGSIIID